MPNRRRRKLATTMSAVAALAVASPCAFFLVYESTAGTKPVEHHEFTRASSMTDLPGELIGALTQGLSQFGVNLPPIPALTGNSGASGTTTPGLGSAATGTTGLGSLLSPSTALPSTGATTPGLGSAATGTSGLGGLLSPSTALPSTGATTPGLLSPSTALPSTGLLSPTTALPSTGLTTPNPALTSPLSGAGEVPITTPTGLDPGLDGTYPVLGDTSGLGGASSSSSSGNGGIIDDVMGVANKLGATQAIDLLKGLIMPAITQAAQNGAAGAAAPGAAIASPLAGAAAPAAAALQGAAAAPAALTPVLPVR